ncbi:MAG: hypothetical protein DRJ42_25210 [Deltaproteobacteria bacterium]|nr:MAG: hypothetical protein DRJ42_25210 [Deltaproteobacteria bacterium]
MDTTNTKWVAPAVVVLVFLASGLLACDDDEAPAPIPQATAAPEPPPPCGDALRTEVSALLDSPRMGRRSPAEFLLPSIPEPWPPSYEGRSLEKRAAGWFLDDVGPMEAGDVLAEVRALREAQVRDAERPAAFVVPFALDVMVPHDEPAAALHRSLQPIGEIVDLRFAVHPAALMRPSDVPMAREEVERRIRPVVAECDPVRVLLDESPETGRALSPALFDRIDQECACGAVGVDSVSAALRAHLRPVLWMPMPAEAPEGGTAQQWLRGHAPAAATEDGAPQIARDESLRWMMVRQCGGFGVGTCRLTVLRFDGANLAAGHAQFENLGPKLSSGHTFRTAAGIELEPVEADRAAAIRAALGGSTPTPGGRDLRGEVRAEFFRARAWVVTDRALYTSPVPPTIRASPVVTINDLVPRSDEEDFPAEVQSPEPVRRSPQNIPEMFEAFWAPALFVPRGS